MFKDYSGSFTAVNGRNRIRSSARKSPAVTGELFSATGLMQKTIGIMLLISLTLGISSTIWYGLRVRVALDQIGATRSDYTELLKENRQLIAKRDLMLSQEHMQKAARKLGLSSPAPDQLRYP